MTLLYSSTKVSLFFNSCVSNPFSVSIGLKEGDILGDVLQVIYK